MSIKYRSSETANHMRARPAWVPSPKVSKIFLSSEQNASCERLSDVRATRKCSQVPDLLARSQFPRSGRRALSVCEHAERICALAGNNYACEIIYTPDCMFYHASAFGTNLTPYLKSRVQSRVERQLFASSSSHCLPLTRNRRNSVVMVARLPTPPLTL